MFRRSIALFNEQFGVTPQLIPGREEVAAVVRSKSKLAVLILIDIIEWFVQVHYTEHVLNKNDLDGLFRDLLKYHWLDEAQHAKIDTMLIAEMVEDMTMAEREAAIDEVLELGGAIDGLLQQQIGMNIDALEVATGRVFSDAERDEITAETLHAWRWTFLVSGLEHPNVVKLVESRSPWRGLRSSAVSLKRSRRKAASPQRIPSLPTLRTLHVPPLSGGVEGSFSCVSVPEP